MREACSCVQGRWVAQWAAACGHVAERVQPPADPGAGAEQSRLRNTCGSVGQTCKEAGVFLSYRFSFRLDAQKLYAAAQQSNRRACKGAAGAGMAPMLLAAFR